MSLTRFNGESIFGSQIKIEGPKQPYRTQDEELPGVDGVRSYRLGAGCKVWTVRGRLVAFTLPQLQGLFLKGLAYVNGRPYAFADNGGRAWPNCQLTDWAQSGRARTCFGLATVEITATVRQLSA